MVESRPPSFNGARGPAKTSAILRATTQAQRRTAAAMARAEAVRAREDNRAWAVERRARTRQLIELGGLVQKAGLVDLTDDDRAVLLGAFLGLVDMLNSEGGKNLVEAWRRRGRGCSRLNSELNACLDLKAARGFWTLKFLKPPQCLI